MDWSRAYAEGKTEGYQQALSDILEAAQALLRAHPEYPAQAFLAWLETRVKE